MKKIISLLFLLAIGLPLFAQDYRKEMKGGNKSYENGKYSEAEVAYKKALEKEAEAIEGNYNLANSLFKQERYEEAIETFKRSVELTNDLSTKSKAYHNLGSSYAKMEKFEEAINAYKQGLKINPKDEEARRNLAKTMRQLQQQKQEQKENKDQDKKDDKDKDKDKEKDKDKDKDKKDEKDQDKDEDGKPKDDDTKKDPKDEKKDKDKKEKAQPGEISKEDAKRLLEALAREEEALQKEMKKLKIKGEPVKTEKDW